MPGAHVPVLIVGGGPCGLALAIELGWRGVACLVVEARRDDRVPHGQPRQHAHHGAPAAMVHRGRGASRRVPERLSEHRAQRVGRGRPARDAGPLARAARARGLPLTIVDVGRAAIADLYERGLVLVRPDGHVAWRGDDLPRDPRALIDRVAGF